MISSWRLLYLNPRMFDDLLLDERSNILDVLLPLLSLLHQKRLKLLLHTRVYLHKMAEERILKFVLLLEVEQLKQNLLEEEVDSLHALLVQVSLDHSEALYGHHLLEVELSTTKLKHVLAVEFESCGHYVFLCLWF